MSQQSPIRSLGALLTRRTLVRLGIIGGAIALAILGVTHVLSASSASTSSEAETGALSLIAQSNGPIETIVLQTQPFSVGLSATGLLEPANQIDLNFSSSAPVTEILVAEGDAVTAGQILACLDRTDTETQLKNAEIALAEAQAALEVLVAPPREIDIAVAEAAVTTAEASVKAASQGPSAATLQAAQLETELARNQLWQRQLNRDAQMAVNPEFRGDNAQANELLTNANLHQAEQNISIAESDYDATLHSGPNLSSLGSAEAQLAQAEAELNRLLTGPTELELRRAEIDIENALLDIDRLQEELRQIELVAPIDGIIASVNLEIGVVPPATEAITLIDTSAFTVDLRIDETDITTVDPGQAVDFRLDALADTTITGQITQIEDAPVMVGQLVTYTALATLNPTDVTLRGGMSVTATIVTETVADALVVPNRFIHIGGDTQQALVSVETAPGVFRDQVVTLGARTTTETQILSGLQAGQTIVLLPQVEESESDGLFS